MRIVRLSPAKNSRFFSCAHSFERITNEKMQKRVFSMLFGCGFYFAHFV